MESEISVAQNNRDFSGARAILSRSKDRIAGAPRTDKFLKETDDRLAIYEGITRYDALLHDGKIAEARALAQQLLANPDMPDPIRHQLQSNKARK